MKIKFVSTIIILLVMSLGLGQTSGLNKTDSNGKKHGKWIVYLDENWKKVEDSTDALYCRYTYFDHGTNIYPMGTAGGKGYRLEPSTEANKKLTMLDGEFKWFDGNAKLSSVHVFKNGEYISCKEYFATGELRQYFDYTKKCEGQLHGWRVTVYYKKGKVKFSSMTCKDKNGKWPLLRG